MFHVEHRNKPMKVLIACEESQTVCKAFRELGHEAYSCDIQECSGGHPEWHIVADVLSVLNGGWFTTQAGTRVYIERWDLMVAHPPCTYLSYAGNGAMKTDPTRRQKQLDALDFFIKLYNAPIPMKCLENPRGVISKEFKRESQVIEPFMFGDAARKRTLLWLVNLPPLLYTAINPRGMVPDFYYIRKSGSKKGGKQGRYFMTANKSAKARSKTFQGIAQAMADQWGHLKP